VAAAAKVAVTEVLAAGIWKLHVVDVIPAQAPPQLVKVAPVFGTALKVRLVPAGKDVPVGDCVMVPGPLGVVVREKTGGVNVAVIEALAVRMKEHVEPVLAAHSEPDQLTNFVPATG
jgi:hypothetical protein